MGMKLMSFFVCSWRRILILICAFAFWLPSGKNECVILGIPHRLYHFNSPATGNASWDESKGWTKLMALHVIMLFSKFAASERVCTCIFNRFLDQLEVRAVLRLHCLRFYRGWEKDSHEGIEGIFLLGQRAFHYFVWNVLKRNVF